MQQDCLSGRQVAIVRRWPKSRHKRAVWGFSPTSFSVPGPDFDWAMDPLAFYGIELIQKFNFLSSSKCAQGWSTTGSMGFQFLIHECREKRHRLSAIVQNDVLWISAWYLCMLSSNSDICWIFHWLPNCVWLAGEPAGSQVHPLHGVSWADRADPQGDRSVIASTQRRLCLLLSDWLGHFHTTCRYFTFLSPTLCLTL